MSKGNFGSGIIGFILGLLTFGLYALFKRKQTEQVDNTIRDSEHHELTRVTKD